MCDGEPLRNSRLDGKFVGCTDAEDDLFAASLQGHARAIGGVAHERALFGRPAIPRAQRRRLQERRVELFDLAAARGISEFDICVNSPEIR